MPRPTEDTMNGRRDRQAWITLAAFALSAAVLIVTLPSLFGAPQGWQKGLVIASGGLTLVLGVALVVTRPRERDIRR
ncbi:hypothetical protein KMZ32_12800 [Phycicoccus sp. MAQZ13P-2]|uniref:hypothetical protein n=1 Tax=Phycicoccus mangrovi TaxID=2840470 RepID=UPI001BFFF9D6|nr:hypothetical protein [Phycicoccus mangrovi]MBT9256900.1 hypothetical protein [Phycicoccus mangrovi]MBT9274951.1 hypothetical protein [Phycicoccus mangrovi]